MINEEKDLTNQIFEEDIKLSETESCTLTGREFTKMDKIASLQKKKNELRCALYGKGTLLKGAHNEFDNYEYFSEAQYKELFTELLSKYKIELYIDELSIESFDGTDKQPFGRRVTLSFALIDVDTGYGETSRHTGEALDRGDKAIYKATTGAIKKFLSSTFLVATKDDPERDDEKPITKKTHTKSMTTNTIKIGTISKVQKERIVELFKDSKKELQDIMKNYNKKKITELDLKEASEIIKGKESENNAE